MSELSRVEKAVSLMRMAMVLLDRNGEREAAARLQGAIDAAIDAPIAATIEQADEMLDTPGAGALLDRLGLRN